MRGKNTVVVGFLSRRRSWFCEESSRRMRGAIINNTLIAFGVIYRAIPRSRAGDKCGLLAKRARSIMHQVACICKIMDDKSNLNKGVHRAQSALLTSFIWCMQHNG